MRLCALAGRRALSRVCFALLLLGCRPPWAAGQAPPAAAPTELTLNVTVTDKQGHYIVGLTRDAFAITIDKTPAETILFADQPAPASIGLVLDTSGSMEDVYRKFGSRRKSLMSDAIARFTQAGLLADEYFLLPFAKAPTPLLEFTPNPQALLAALDQTLTLEAQGQTALYDACYQAVLKAAAGRHAKRVLILFTDGQDNQSRHKFEETIRLLKERGVQLYAVSFTADPRYSSELEESAQAILDNLTAATGGRVFYVQRRSELPAAFERLAVELRSQYTLKVRAAGLPPEPREQRIKIKVTSPSGLKQSLKARSSPAFYLAPAKG